MIGSGLALLPIHNKWLTDIATNSEGETLFFLPVFGYLPLIMGTGLFLIRNWEKVKESGWGDKKVVIPLLVITGAIGLSGITADGWQDKIAPLGMGLVLFAVYLAARVLGKDIFLAFIPLVVIGVVSIVIGGFLSPGQYTGGFITNYCASAGYIILGTLLVLPRWPLVAIAIFGLFFIGALEAVFIVGVLGIVAIARRDIGKPFYALIGCMLVIVWFWWLLGYLIPLYTGSGNISHLGEIISGKATLDYDLLDDLTTHRWGVYIMALSDIRLLGHGLFLGTTGGGIVHNLPLIIMHQVGPVAAVAWSFVTIYCLVKTRWKYAWIAVIATCVFDHYLWTQFLPLWWALVGVSTASRIKSDLIFRRRDEVREVVENHTKIKGGNI